VGNGPLAAGHGDEDVSEWQRARINMAAPRSGRGRTAASIHVGTSGWTYDDWWGPFYPEGLRSGDRLSYYAGRFDTVEVNSSFYRVPSEVAVRAWNERLPPHFHLVLKGNRRITHRSPPGADERALDFFLERALALRRLRVILWQFPPFFHPDLEALDAFLERLPGGVRHAVEFRDAGWWDSGADEVLARHRAAFVAVSHPTLPEDIRVTTDFLYVRFHGRGERLYEYDYSRRELAVWARRLSAAAEGKRRIYAFFNNDWHAHAPANAAVLAELLRARASAGEGRSESGNRSRSPRSKSRRR